MKALLLILACAIYPQTVKDGNKIQDWTWIGESPDAIIYFGTTTVQRDGDTIKVWLRVDFPNGSDVFAGSLRAGKDLGSIRGYGVFNCNDLTANSHEVLVLYYDRQGRLVKRQKETEHVQNTRPQESNGLTAIFSYFCESVDVPVSGPPRLKPR